MEKLLRALALVPFITAIMQGIKQLLTEKAYKFMWIITCVVGIVSAYWYVQALQLTDMTISMIVFGGVIAGLSASWLYEATKNTINSLK